MRTASLGCKLALHFGKKGKFTPTGKTIAFNKASAPKRVLKVYSMFLYESVQTSLIALSGTWAD